MKRLLLVLVVLALAALACSFDPVEPTQMPATETQEPTATAKPTDTPTQIPTPTPIVRITPDGPSGIFIVQVEHLHQRICNDGVPQNPVAECTILRDNTGRANYAPLNAIYATFTTFSSGNIRWACVEPDCGAILATCNNGEAYGELRVNTTVEQYLSGNLGTELECN